MDNSKSEGQKDGGAKGAGWGDVLKDAGEAFRDAAAVGFIAGATGAPVAPVQQFVQELSGGYNKPKKEAKDEGK